MQYQTYFLTSNDQILSKRYGDYASDTEAFAALAWVMGMAAAAEVWCGSRCVGLVTAEEVRNRRDRTGGRGPVGRRREAAA